MSMRTARQRIGVSLALFLLLCSTQALAQTGTIAPSPKFTALDNNGLPCNGCLLYTYAAGTTTNAATYADSALTTPNANPVVLDASGRATIFLSATSYKFVLKTSANVTLWTVDNVSSVGLATAAVGSQLVVFGGQNTSPVTATTYAVGTTYAQLHAGTLMWSFDSANVVGTYALEGMCLGNGGTITASLVNLTDGNPQTPLVSISSSNSAGERQISGAVTFALPGAAKIYGIKTIVSAGYGYCWMIRLVRLS